MSKWIYRFDEVSQPDPLLLGGKGSNLADMTRAKLPIPPGFIVSTAACHLAFANEGILPEPVHRQIGAAMRTLEQLTDKGWGRLENPLLVSVRSGAPISMPGMMDTVLNLGLNDETVEGLVQQTGNPRFAYDCYRRLIEMFGEIVLGIARDRFRHPQEGRHLDLDREDVSAEQLRDLIAQYHAIVVRETGRPFPHRVDDQLGRAVEAVFRSWNTPRAKTYRAVHNIADGLGTAVTVQCMVFGNLGDDSGTGVAFTRDPSTGESRVFGEYLPNAQGEDVVAGIRTPKPLHQLAEAMPACYRQLLTVCRQLEDHYRDVQDVEFTIERGRLYILQTRPAKRSGPAAVRIATDLVKEGTIDAKRALMMVEPEHLEHLLHPTIDEEAGITVIAQGLPASPGAACGRITLNANDAVHRASRGEGVILVRTETTADDIHGILAASGVLTSRGGMTSHAAVVARGMGKPCVTGCDALSVREEENACMIGQVRLTEGDVISIDGATGRVMLDAVTVRPAQLSDDVHRFLQWSDQERMLGVRANADTTEEARLARSHGAEGIGLCRTEHMFLREDRIPLVQSMLLASADDERQDALERLYALQHTDFYGILKEMDGLPVTIRLLDAPLHEFLPNLEQLAARQAELRVRLQYDPASESLRESWQETADLLNKVKSLHEHNPMLGLRGCRLGITFPEVYEMQVRAIFDAAVTLRREGLHPQPEIMIPLIAHAEEFRRLRMLVDRTAQRVFEQQAAEIPYLVGSMIEVPRAALTADAIAAAADFFSFGTNDLTQTTLAYSRDDAESKFLPVYLRDKLLADNPFAVLDEDGVGKLIAMAASQGRQANPSLKLGLCGEHGGEKRSISFCHRQQLTYVSCSPFRVPLARLAAAQTALSSELGKG